MYDREATPKVPDSVLIIDGPDKGARARTRRGSAAGEGTGDRDGLRQAPLAPLDARRDPRSLGGRRWPSSE